MTRRRSGNKGKRPGADPLTPRLAEARQLHQQGHRQAAEQAYRSILMARREHPEALKGLADIALTSGRIPMAVELLSYCVAIASKDVEAHYRLAVAQRRSGLSEQAELSLDAALVLRGKSPQLHNEKGVLLSFQGRHAEALESFRRAIRLDGDCVEAHFHLAYLKRFSAHDIDLLALEKLDTRRDALRPDECAALDFALGKARDDCGDYPRAFAAFERGNRAVQAERPYDHAAMEVDFQRCREVFTPARVAELSGQGSDSSVPVIIVGMPRSGSTLLEHRLAAHPSVASAGEGPWLLQSLQAVQPAGIPGGDPLAWFAALDTDDLQRLGDDYAARLQGQAGRQPRVVDKTLLNFLHLGMLALMLPKAIILHCRRHPLDTGLSIFQQYFTEGQNFAFDLHGIGQFYDLYRHYMALWQDRFPGRIIDVDYEDLVADTESEMRRVVAATGLDWAPECVDQATGGGRFNTASKAQVTRPVYRSSVGRWRNYAEQLAPLRAVLGEAGEPD